MFLTNEELAILTASSKLVSLPLSILLTTHPLLISVSFLLEDHEIRRRWQLLKVLKYTQISNFHVVDSSFMSGRISPSEAMHLQNSANINAK